MSSGFWSLSLNVLWGLCVLIFVYCLVLLVFQRHLLYFPSTYTPQMLQLASQKESIHYELSGKSQVAYFIPARSHLDQPPECLWIMIGGNAAVALGWSDLVDHYSDGRTAFLLIDYPGYGQNEGRPSLKNNIAAVDLAYRALLEHLSISEDGPLPFRVGVLGHSLGGAMAVALAEQYPVDMLMLLSPFTSMKAMVREHLPVLGLLLGEVLWDTYQVETVLDQIMKGPKKPKVLIMHGTQDEIVPVAMSRQMTNKSPSLISYQEIPDADHNFVYAYRSLIIDNMQKLCTLD